AAATSKRCGRGRSSCASPAPGAARAMSTTSRSPKKPRTTVPTSGPQSAMDCKILILDYGSQYTQLIARRVREAGVYSEIYAHDAAPEAIAAFGAAGIILSGGPDSAGGEASPRIPGAVFEAG